jgi:hypothetical protein
MQDSPAFHESHAVPEFTGLVYDRDFVPAVREVHRQLQRNQVVTEDGNAPTHRCHTGIAASDDHSGSVAEFQVID